MRIVDPLIVALLGAIGILVVTGGFHYSSPAAKLELSQVDAFAWALLALIVLRRVLWKKWLPKSVERVADEVLAFFSRNARFPLTAAIALYVVLQTWNSAWRYDSFHATAFDLSFVEQALWSTTRFGFLHSTLSKGQTYLGEHFSPALGAIALLYRAFDSITFLFFLQSLILASGAWLVYALAREKKLPRPIAALTGLAFLSYQPLRLANNFDFREDNLFVPVFLGMLLALEKRKWKTFWLLCAASWTIKENAAIFTCLTGLWVAGEAQLRRQPKAARERASATLHGATLAALSLVVFAVVNTKITPLFVGQGAGAQTMLRRRMPHFGETNGEILKFMLLHPIQTFLVLAEPLFQLKAVKYFLDVTLPFLAFVPAAPLVAPIVVAGMVMNLLVNLPTIGFHYECVIIPFLFYILVAGLARLQRVKKLSGAAIPTLVAISFLLSYGRSPVESIRHHAPTERDRFVESELEKIPPEASIATQAVLHPHLTHRRDAYLYSPALPPADYVVFDLDPSRSRYGTPQLDEAAARIDAKTYDLVLDRESLKIWKRK
ncbi:MAG: DUF2079 domain-containing protein [Deltaproteobacteria bacterium]|nr:DUF2079 domain-containing protein [Deltaproteobacteria bacterium]